MGRVKVYNKIKEFVNKFYPQLHCHTENKTLFISNSAYSLNTSYKVHEPSDYIDLEYWNDASDKCLIKYFNLDEEYKIIKWIEGRIKWLSKKSS